MMFQAKHILNEEFSGSDTSCGGHITLSVDAWDGVRLFNAVREFSGVIQSLYRVRHIKPCMQNVNPVAVQIFAVVIKL